MKAKLFYFPIHFGEQTSDYFSDKLTPRVSDRSGFETTFWTNEQNNANFISEDNKDNGTILNKNTVQPTIGEAFRKASAGKLKGHLLTE